MSCATSLRESSLYCSFSARRGKLTQNLITVSKLLLLVTAVIATGTSQGNSGAEERTRWVEITHKLENDPLDEDLSRQGDATVKAIENDHSMLPAGEPAVSRTGTEPIKFQRLQPNFHAGIQFSNFSGARQENRAVKRV